MDLRPGDSWAILIALLIGMLAAIVPRVLSGPAEHPAVLPALASEPAYGRQVISPAFAMGLQAACGALVVVALNRAFGLAESAWAITACVYVVATSAVGTAERVRRRIYGTLVGVPIGIVCLPLAEHWPLVVWMLSAFAMIVYAMALPERYDIACGAFAFVLIVTLAASGVHSVELLTARAWETLLGGALGLVASRVVFPLRVVNVRRQAASNGIVVVRSSWASVRTAHRCATFSSKRSSMSKSTGFTRCASKPACAERSLSLSCPNPVIATTVARPMSRCERNVRSTA